MNPITHLLLGWGLANSAPLDRRERACVTLASVVPDLDGLGIIVDVATWSSAAPTELWGTYHHVLGHNLGFALAVGLTTLLVTRGRWIATLLTLLSFHLHLLGDLIGARGPDGDQWPIPYLLPFSDLWQLVWSGQWGLNAWPNFLITIVLLALTFYLAWERGYSPLELVSGRADRGFVTALRQRFGFPTGRTV